MVGDNRLIDESIPWLVAQGRYKEANKAMQRAARMNKVEIPDNVFSAESEVFYNGFTQTPRSVYRDWFERVQWSWVHYAL